MDFPQEILSPQKVLFKKGAVLGLIGEASDFGRRGIIVHGMSLGKNSVKEKILKTASAASCSLDFFCRKGGEPALNEITEVIEKARAFDARWIAGIGGGSVLDLAKAAAGLFSAKREPSFYQEGGVLQETGIPFIAVPTTAGTGSEATINSVIINPEKKSKLSIRDKSFLARKVILDPELLKGLPVPVMRFSGMDALVQGYESFISKNSTWYSDVLALKSIELISRHLESASGPQAETHYAPLLLGSYLAGMALALARLGVIHGIAHPLGVLYGEPHGLVCSVCFVPSIKLNREAMGNKYALLSQAVGMDFLQKVEQLLATFKMLSPFRGKPLIEKEKIILETLQSGSTAANPKPVVRDDVEFLLDEIFRPF